MDGMLNQAITAGLQHPHPMLRAKSENTMTTLMDPVALPAAAASMPPAQVALHLLLVFRGRREHRHQSANHSFSLVPIRLSAGPLSLWGAPAVPAEPEPDPRPEGEREERRRKSSKNNEGGRGEFRYQHLSLVSMWWWFSKLNPVSFVFCIFIFYLADLAG